MIFVQQLCVILQYHENNKAITFYYLAKQTLHNPTPQLGLIVIFLYIDIELLHVLYSRNTNTQETQLFRYERLLTSWLLSSVLRHEERDTQFLKVFHIILCKQNSNARHISWSFRSFIFAGQDPKNLTICLNDRNPNFSTLWSELNFYCLSTWPKSTFQLLTPWQRTQFSSKSSVFHGPKSTPNCLVGPHKRAPHPVVFKISVGRDLLNSMVRLQLLNTMVLIQLHNIMVGTQLLNYLPLRPTTPMSVHLN